MSYLRLFLESLAPQLGPGVEGIELESERPSFGISVVSLKEVASRSIGPFVYWLFNHTDIEQGKEGALACSQVALD